MPRSMRAARAAEASLHLSDQKFIELSGKMRDAYQKMDATLAHTLRMNADMIETGQEIGLEPEVGQKLFADLNKVVNTMMNGRQELVEAHLEATRIRMRTDQAERSDGCFRPKFTGSAHPLRAVA